MSGGFMAFSMWCKTPGTFGPLGLNPLGMHPKLSLYVNMQYGSSTSSTINMSELGTIWSCTKDLWVKKFHLSVKNFKCLFSH
uniref:Uncharacterized protein n=1 Tax=Meloidogyne enterolobii TaxID=390850 RepID=A0A6V7XT63_MELEN|nr:unnamed protein product [Meloidogyne enterolobii]